MELREFLEYCNSGKTIGDGAAATKDVPVGTVSVGVPAKVVRKVEESVTN